MKELDNISSEKKLVLQNLDEANKKIVGLEQAQHNQKI